MKYVFFLIFLTCGCSNPKDACLRLNNTINYDETLYAVRKKVIDLTWIEEPLTYPEFVQLTKYADCFKKNAVGIIKLNKNDKTMIGLAILSMKELKSDETILFANDIIDFIDAENLLIWLYGAYGNNNFIQNYDDRKYIDFFNLCKNKFPNEEEKIIYLRDGKMQNKSGNN